MFKNKNEVGYSSPEKAMSKKEQIAIITGFVLILSVFVFTSIRSINWKKSSGSTAAATNQGASQTAPNYNTISSKDLMQQIQQNKGVALLDVRIFNDYIRDHLIDSVNVPVDEIAQSDKIHPSDKIVVIGASENDSNVDSAVALLKDKHVADLKVLAGGLAAWELNGGPTTGFGDPTSFVDQAKVFYLDAQQTHDMIKNDPNNIVLLDVRDASDFAQGHVPNAINIPLLDLEKRRGDLPAVKKILIFGVTDVAEFQAGVQIHDLTTDTPYVVKGSMQGWRDAKFEVTQ